MHGSHGFVRRKPSRGRDWGQLAIRFFLNAASKRHETILKELTTGRSVVFTVRRKQVSGATTLYKLPILSYEPNAFTANGRYYRALKSVIY